MHQENWFDFANRRMSTRKPSSSSPPSPPSSSPPSSSSSSPPWSPFLFSESPSSVSSEILSKELALEVVAATTLLHPATGLLQPITELPPQDTAPLPMVTDVATLPSTSRASQICSNKLPTSRARPTTAVLSETQLKTSTGSATHRDPNDEATNDNNLC